MACLIQRPHLLHFLYPGQGMMMTMGFLFLVFEVWRFKMGGLVFCLENGVGFCFLDTIRSPMGQLPKKALRYC